MNARGSRNARNEHLSTRSSFGSAYYYVATTTNNNSVADDYGCGDDDDANDNPSDDYGFASVARYRGVKRQSSWAPPATTDVSSEVDHLVQTIDELLSSESSTRGDNSQDDEGQLDYSRASQRTQTRNTNNQQQQQLQVFHHSNPAAYTNHHYGQHLYQEQRQHHHQYHQERRRQRQQHNELDENLVEPISITGGLIVDGGGQVMGGNVIGVGGRSAFSQNSSASSSLQRFALRQRDPANTIADLYGFNGDAAAAAADHRRPSNTKRGARAPKYRDRAAQFVVGARLANLSLSQAQRPLNNSNHDRLQLSSLDPADEREDGACECESCQYNNSSSLAISTFGASNFHREHQQQQQHPQQQQRQTFHSARLPAAWSSSGQLQFKTLSSATSGQTLCASNSSATTFAALDSSSKSSKSSRSGGKQLGNKLMASSATFDRKKKSSGQLAATSSSRRRNQLASSISSTTMKARKAMKGSRSRSHSHSHSHLHAHSHLNSPSLSRCAKLTKLILVLAQLAFVAAGICIGVWGILSQVEDYKYHLSTLYVFSEESPKSLLQLLSVAFIIMACLIFLFGSLGLLATHHNSKWLSSLFVLLLLVVFALNLAIGLMAIILQERLSASIRSKLVNKFQEQYGIESPFTSAVDYVQTKYECCGIEGSFDYERSVWRLQRLGGLDAVVARTCCRLQNSSDDLAYINPRPANETMCQSNDTRFQQNFRFRKGCTESIEQLLRQKIWIYVFCCSVLSAIILLILILAISFCSALKKRQNYREKAIAAAAATQASAAQQQQQQQQQLHLQANHRPPSSTRSTLM